MQKCETKCLLEQLVTVGSDVLISWNMFIHKLMVGVKTLSSNWLEMTWPKIITNVRAFLLIG